jgi:hypothetical protein
MSHRWFWTHTQSRQQICIYTSMHLWLWSIVVAQLSTRMYATAISRKLCYYFFQPRSPIQAAPPHSLASNNPGWVPSSRSRPSHAQWSYARIQSNRVNETPSVITFPNHTHTPSLPPLTLNSANIELRHSNICFTDLCTSPPDLGLQAYVRPFLLPATFTFYLSPTYWSLSTCASWSWRRVSIIQYNLFIVPTKSNMQPDDVKTTCDILRMEEIYIVWWAASICSSGMR